MNDEASTEMVSTEDGSTAVAQSSDWFEPKSLKQAYWLASQLQGSALLPPTFRSASDILIGLQYAKQLGLPFLQLAQGCAVINGRPSLWGDTMLALCQKHHAWGGMIETLEGEGDNRVAICRLLRKENPAPIERKFSVADARLAGLWGTNVWKRYPQRMLQMRARSWALRDGFADALAGFSSAEEMEDVVYHQGPVKILKPKRSSAQTKKAQKETPPEAVAGEPKKDSGMPQREFAKLCAALTKFKGNSKSMIEYWKNYGEEARQAIGQCASQLKRVNELLAGAGVAYAPAGQTSNAPTYDIAIKELVALPPMQLADAWEQRKAGYQEQLSAEDYQLLEAQVAEWFRA